jgi:hypothetical protein
MDGDNAMGSLGLAIEAVLKAHPLNTGVVTPSAQFPVPQGAAVLIPGMSIAANSTQQELFVCVGIADIDISAADPGLVTVGIYVDGALTRNSNFRLSPTTTGRSSTPLFHAQTYAAGNHTIEVRAGKANAGGTATILTSSPFAVLRFPR